MSYVGDIKPNQVINKKFTTVSSSGAPTSFTGLPILAAYKDSSLTETLLGITVTINFDAVAGVSLTGLNHILIDTSQNPSFYSTGSDIDVIVLAGTVSSISLSGYNPLSFSIENRGIGYMVSTERNAIADAFLNRDMSTGTDSGSTTVRTVRQALRFLRNKWTLTSGTLSIKKEDDSTESWSATVGTTLSSDGIISLDPAGP
jgi:hypothetical protein